MKTTISISLLALLALPVLSRGQENANLLPDAPSQVVAQISDQQSDPASPSAAVSPAPARPAPAFNTRFGAGEKFRYYMNETFLIPAAVTAPAFRAGLRMANPPVKGQPDTPRTGGRARRASGTTSETPSRSGTAFGRHV